MNIKDELTAIIVASLPPELVPNKTPILGAVIAKADAGPAAALLCASIANMIGNIPDEKWNDMVKFDFPPCETPDCDCHLVQKRMMESLVPVRKIFERAIARASGEEGFSA